jgi:hypothetical protein
MDTILVGERAALGEDGVGAVGPLHEREGVRGRRLEIAEHALPLRLEGDREAQPDVAELAGGPLDGAVAEFEPTVVLGAADEAAQLDAHATNRIVRIQTRALGRLPGVEDAATRDAKGTRKRVEDGG